MLEEMAVDTVDQQLNYTKHMLPGGASGDMLSQKYVEAELTDPATAAAAAAMMDFDKLYLPTHHINSFLPANGAAVQYPPSMFQVGVKVNAWFS